MTRRSYHFEELAGHIADALWGTDINLSYDQIRECLHIADALTKLGYHKTEDGAATPPPDPHDQPAPTGGDLAVESATGATNTAAASSSSTGPGPAVIGGQPGPVVPRGFELVRHRDLSGVSGTGVVAEGCVFTDGSVALRWRGEHPATAVWPDLESVLAVHGHQGATVVRWIGADVPIDLWPAEGDHRAD